MSERTLSSRFSKNRLVVIINDRLSELVKKGEITPRYYNPGELFKEVHILTVNEDEVDVDAVQQTVGSAILKVHHLPPPPFKKSLGWRPFLIRQWIRKGIEIARQIQPELVRCHGNDLNSYLAQKIREKLGVPYLVSMHTDPDESFRLENRSLKEKLIRYCISPLGRGALKNADMVLPVYQPILPYLNRLKIPRFQLAYNVIHPAQIRKKTQYSVGKTFRIVSVGRHLPRKNPENLILALKSFPNAMLDLIGDGPIHDNLKSLVLRENLSDRVNFFPAIPNGELCARLPDYDLFAIHSDYFEISKSLLEALLTGLPCIVNERPGPPVPELQSGLVVLVENSIAGYRNGIGGFIDDEACRERFGSLAARVAWENWDPATTERLFVSIYESILGEKACHKSA